MPDRRQEFSGRRESDPKKPADPPADPPKPDPPKNEQRPEVEPDRRHFLHRKVGGKPKKKQAAA